MWAPCSTVPGGQQLYVTVRGALSYTRAHSGAIPPGAATVGFMNEPGPSYGHFSFNGLGATGFVACPVAGASTKWSLSGSLPRSRT